MSRRPRDAQGDLWAVANGNIIRRERRNRGLTQTALGALTGKSSNEISAIESNGALLEDSTKEIFATAFGLHVRLLFGFIADEKYLLERRVKRGWKLASDAHMAQETIRPRLKR